MAPKPKRFLDANGEAIPGPAETRENGHNAFGLERHACAGEYLSSESSSSI